MSTRNYVAPRGAGEHQDALYQGLAPLATSCRPFGADSGCIILSGPETGLGLSLFDAELEFCRETRFWRQKPQVAAIVELANDAKCDETNDRSGVRIVCLPCLLTLFGRLGQNGQNSRLLRVPVAQLTLGGQREVKSGCQRSIYSPVQ